MKSYFLLIFLCFQFSISEAQKMPLDTNTFGSWPSLNDINISDDGKYALYIERLFSPDHGILVIRSTSGSFCKEFRRREFNNVQFSTDSKKVFFLSHDTLGLVDLPKGNIQFIPNAKQYKITVIDGKNYVAYIERESKSTLAVLNLDGKDRLYFEGITDFQFTKNGRLVLRGMQDHNEFLKIVTLRNKQVLNIWHGQQIGQLISDDTNHNFCFNTIGDNNHLTFYYFSSNSNSATLLFNETNTLLADKTFDSFNFNKAGDRILFYLSPIKNKISKSILKNAANVDIWNYKDEMSQSSQLKAPWLNPFATRSTIAYDLTTREIVPVSVPGEFVFYGNNFERYILKCNHYFNSQGFYNREYASTFSLVDIDNNTEQKIIENHNVNMIGFSPNQKYLLWFDPDSLAYFSYEVTSGTKRNLSNMVSKPLYDEAEVKVNRRNYSAYGIAGWSSDENWVYIYDKYDIWKVNLAAKCSPVNVTNAYGSRNGITFGIISPFTPRFTDNVTTIINFKTNLILSGFNPATKDNGFWQINEGKIANPKVYFEGSYCYYISRTDKSNDYDNYATGNCFVKAKKADVYLFQRMSTSEYPNIFATNDFHNYCQLSDIHPDKPYNWITSELVTWKMLDGKLSQGILYKPEHFDPKKKYPVIFNYYEKNSDLLHQYITPEWTRDQINVPYYVSNGYLMFIPDIYYKQGHNGQSVVNAVVSAAKYLSTFPYVDSTRLAIQGHSFGGWETNYLVTHTNIFAAAGEGAGVSDQVSSYDQYAADGADGRQQMYEVNAQGSAYGIGLTPWTATSLYIENSPVFSVQNASTPLLIMQGDADTAVPFAQSIEVFQAMKRAGKKVWLLQYEHQNHGLSGVAAKDYTIRMKQFFDFYLKGAPPPIWMTRGVPASLKGIDNGLEIDTSGTRP
ncbi:MAG TPA: prolyl oligopeptidase family serine peptidase [Mucilaginibacter sp.]|nr:prolyl oligopeptidase family serine peptidase [Mucilaginibacter sp.]